MDKITQYYAMVETPINAMFNLQLANGDANWIAHIVWLAITSTILCMILEKRGDSDGN